MKCCWRNDDKARAPSDPSTAFALGSQTSFGHNATSARPVVLLHDLPSTFFCLWHSVLRALFFYPSSTTLLGSIADAIICTRVSGTLLCSEDGVAATSTSIYCLKETASSAICTSLSCPLSLFYAVEYVIMCLSPWRFVMSIS